MSGDDYIRDRWYPAIQEFLMAADSATTFDRDLPIPPMCMNQVPPSHRAEPVVSEWATLGSQPRVRRLSPARRVGAAASCRPRKPCPVRNWIWVLISLGGCWSSNSSLDPSPSLPVPPPTPVRSAGSEEAKENLNGAWNAPPESPRPARDDDWFEDVTQRCGVNFTYRTGREAEQFTMPEMFGGGVGLFDFDCDGDIDLLCIGGGQISRTVEITGRAPALYRNDGDWKFTDVTREVGLDVPLDYSHGCTVGDYNRDGFPDLWISCYGHSRLYRNDQGRAFTDVTESAGLAFDGWSTGATFADINRDGWPDLYVATYLKWEPDPKADCRNPHSGRRDVCMPGDFSGGPDRLFLNRQDGRFEEISRQAGLVAEGKGLGVVAGDFNDDGWIDFYVVNDVIRNYLYLGRGDNRFEEQAILAGAAGNEYGVPEGSMGLDYGDYDGDGRGDLFVTNYELEENSLYHNDGDGMFSHSTFAVGLAGKCRPDVGWATGFADFDSDGWLDLFIVNGHVVYHNRQSPFRQPSFIYRNVGGKRFEDVTERAGPWFSFSHNGRGAAVGDLDNDGAPDLVVSQWDEPVVVLRNRLRPKNWVSLELRGTRHDINAVGASAQVIAGEKTLTRFVRGGGGYASYFDPRLLFALPDSETTSMEARVRWSDGHEELFSDLATRQIHRVVEGRGIAVASQAVRD